MRLKSRYNDRDDTNRSSEKYPSFVTGSPTKQGPDHSNVESDIASHTPSKPSHDNLTKSERSALYDLPIKDTADFLRKQDAMAPFPPETLFCPWMLLPSIPIFLIRACGEVWEPVMRTIFMNSILRVTSGARVKLAGH